MRQEKWYEKEQKTMLKKSDELYPTMTDALDGKLTFQEITATTLKFSRRVHPEHLRSCHEGLGVILEEFDELKEAVRLKCGMESVLAELASVSAMCQRLAEDYLSVKECNN